MIYYLFKIIIYYQLYSKKVIDAIITLFSSNPFLSMYTLDFTTEFINSCSGTKLYLFLEKVLDTKSHLTSSILKVNTYGSKNGGKCNNK